MRRIGLRALLLAGALCALTGATSAGAFQELPPGGQVNDDLAAGINKFLSVGSQDPTNADVVGGALTEGKPAVPWATFRQTEGPEFRDQIFARSFAAGNWLTRGSGTVGGRSSTSPKFSGSLNFDQTTDGEAPAIDFAGKGRTVPWATWYEDTSGEPGFFGEGNVFASRFDGLSGKWIFAGQGRGTGGKSVPVPSLNIHTYEDAENPSVAGGSATEPGKPGPWVTWQEFSEFREEEIGEEEFEEFEEHDQIYVERPEGPGMPNCDTTKPEGVKEGEHIPAIGGFCWQQVGTPRWPPPAREPSLNVDPTREGVEPDIAFTGAEDKVPWVVWYEKQPGELGLRSNEMVFAAKAVSDGEGAHGGFHWEVVGSAEKGVLDTSGTNGLGKCSESVANEEKCSLNKDPTKDAEDPRVAAGTMNPTPPNPTSPWVAWDEEVEGTKRIFVSRLVGGTHFELANGGAPISAAGHNATRPDITFSGNTPYVSWRQETGPGEERAFYGHFVNAANPTFVPDESVPITPASEADVREPISSGCIATPFNADGAHCQGEAIGTPFFLFTNTVSPSTLGLFADAYKPAPASQPPSGVTGSSAVMNGSVNPLGASVAVFFEYGATTAYGSSTGVLKLGPEEGNVPFAATLAGLAPGSTVHYRAVAVSDFGRFFGADQAFTTTAPGGGGPAPPPPPPNGKASFGHVTVSGGTLRVRVHCTGPAGTKCKLSFKLTVTELFRGHRLIAVTARRKLKRKVVVVGSATVTLNAGESRTVKISLNGTGKRLLARRHKLKVKLRVTQTLVNGKASALLTQTLTLKAPRRHRHHR